ncbi:MAG: hypothetical protein IJ399_04165 [Bacilli bacterium]|nr:hypothetical protein [Bacilli bacterium]
MNNNIEEKVVNNLTNKYSKELIDLMKECNISDSVIMLSIMGIGTHTAYYGVLYNRIMNNKEQMNDELAKKLVIELFREIDKNEE